MRFSQSGVVLFFPSSAESKPPLTCKMIRSEVSNRERASFDMLDQIIIMNVVNAVDMSPIKLVCNLCPEEDQKLSKEVCARLLSAYSIVKEKVAVTYQDTMKLYDSKRNALSKLDEVNSIAELDKVFYASKVESIKKSDMALDLLNKECQETIGYIVDDHVVYTE